MSRDDIQKLLGGYATGTLTPEEQQALFEAALTDQELFDALAREEALRDVLSDPSARAHLLAALDDAPARWYQQRWYRQWWRPMVVITAAALAIVGVAVWEMSPATKELETAKVELPRFTPPVQAPSSPMLPPPPEVRRAAPATARLTLPLPAPVAPPVVLKRVPAAAPAPPAPARDANDLFTVNGSVSSGLQTQQAPRQQAPQFQAQQFQAQQFQAQQAQTQQSQTGLGSQIQPPPAPSPATGNNFLAPASVPLHGTVVDASGAAVPSARVAVKSLSTGETTNTSTDAKGEFTASAAPGSAVQISASAAGFQAVTVSQQAPVNGTPAPVNLTLPAGASSQTVEVTGTDSAIQSESRANAPRGAIGGVAMEAKKAKTAAAPAPAIAYQLFRPSVGGDPVEVLANGTVPPGSSLTLRVTPITDGYLRIVEDGRTIAHPKVRRGVASETVLPPSDKLGRVELQVYFSREATESKTLPPAFTMAFNIQ